MAPLAPQMRTKFAESALELFSERGFDNVNLDAIAAHAGVTKGSLYWHYESKKELIVAACAHFYREWQRQLHAEIATAADPLERLRRAVLFCVDNCMLNRVTRNFSTQLFVMALYDEEIRAGWVEFFDAVRALLVGLVQRAREAGEIPTTDPGWAVDLVLAMMDGMEKRAAFDPGVCAPKKRQLIYEELMRILHET